MGRRLNLERMFAFLGKLFGVMSRESAIAGLMHWPGTRARGH
jgi:hypothetical protein